MSELTPLGELLERARADLRISGREASRRAGISETRWRQIVSGRQIKDGRDIPVNPKPRTVAAMALAVLADPETAIRVAGFDGPVNFDRLIEDVREELRGTERSAGSGGVAELTSDENARLNAEIARIEGMRLSASAKLTMLEALMRAWEQYAAERDDRDAGSAAG